MKAFLTGYEVASDGSQRLLAALESERVEACGIYSSGDRLRLYVPAMSAGRFEKLAERLGTEYTVISRGLFCRLPGSLRRRAGLVAGAAVCAAAVLLLRDRLLEIKVLTDDPVIRGRVINILAEDGVGVGSFIPELDCAVLERDLKQRARGISWAGISRTDSTLIIDVIETTDKPEERTRRLPSDLIAKHSGRIEEIVVYDGLLKIPVGSGVVRGDVVVSGRVPQTVTVMEDGKPVTEYSERYVRAQGEAYGSYSIVRTFEQPYSEQSIAMDGSCDEKTVLRVFGAELPLYFGGDGGLYKETAEYHPLTVFGRGLPAGIKKLRREGYSLRTVCYTKEQAERRAEELMENFESNFLAEERIISREKTLEHTQNGVKLTVKYELYGVMTEEKQFFIKK